MKTFLGFLVATGVTLGAFGLRQQESQAQVLSGQDATQRYSANALLLALAREADAIVVGRVQAANSYWSADHTLILTDYIIQTAENLKGVAPATLRLTAEGGEVGDIGLVVSDEIKLERHARYALFLKNTAGRFTVLKGAVGAQSIDAANAALRVDVQELKSVIQTIAKEQKHENQ